MKRTIAICIRICIHSHCPTDWHSKTEFATIHWLIPLLIPALLKAISNINTCRDPVGTVINILFKF